MFVVAVAVIFLPFKIPELGFSRVTEVVWERSLHPCQGPKDMLYIWTKISPTIKARVAATIISTLLLCTTFYFCYHV